MTPWQPTIKRAFITCVLRNSLNVELVKKSNLGVAPSQIWPVLETLRSMDLQTVVMKLNKSLKAHLVHKIPLYLPALVSMSRLENLPDRCGGAPNHHPHISHSKILGSVKTVEYVYSYSASTVRFQ